METQHRVSIGEYRETIPEQDARRIFRSFTPEMFEYTFSSVLSDPEIILNNLNTQPRLRMRGGRKFPLLGNTERIYERTPDILAFTCLIYSLPVDLMIEAYPNLFRQLIDRPNETTDQMLQAGLGFRLTYGGAHPRLRQGIHITFTPPSEGDVFLESESGRSLKGVTQMIQALPDLSGLPTPEERFDAAIDLITYDIQDALHEVLQLEGLTIEEFAQLKESDQARFGRIHKKAGLLYAQKNFYAILSDQINGGENNLFDVHEDQGDEPKKTDFGQCPGIGFARNYFIGLGQSLKANREVVLPVITTWDYFGT